MINGPSVLALRIPAALAVLAAGCGNVEVHPDAPAGQPDAGGAVDAPAGADAAPLGPWTTPQLLDGLSSSSFDWSPTLRGDLLEIYFSSNRNGALQDLFVATRPTASAAWSTPVPVTALNRADAHDLRPSLSPDGLTLYFTSNRDDASLYELFRTTRPSVSAGWAAPVAVTELAGSEVYAESVLASGLAMVVAGHLDIGGMGGSDLYLATRATTDGAWTTVTPIPGVNSNLEDYDATLSEDRLRIYLSSNRGGTLSIYYADRPTADVAFGPPQRITAISDGAVADAYVWVSADERTMVFCSERTSALMDIFQSTR